MGYIREAPEKRGGHVLTDETKQIIWANAYAIWHAKTGWHIESGKYADKILRCVELKFKGSSKTKVKK